MTTTMNYQPGEVLTGKDIFRGIYDVIDTEDVTQQLSRAKDLLARVAGVEDPAHVRTLSGEIVDKLQDEYSHEKFKKGSDVEKLLDAAFWEVGTDSTSRTQLVRQKVALLATAEVDQEIIVGLMRRTPSTMRKEAVKQWKHVTEKSSTVKWTERLFAGLGVTTALIAVFQPAAAAVETVQIRTVPGEYENYPLNFTEQAGGVNMPENGEISIGLDANKLSDTRYKSDVKVILQTLNNNPALVDMYKTIQSETGLDWRIIAAFHYREHSMSLVNPKNGQGIFQNTGGGFPTSGTATKEQMVKEGKYMVEFLKGKLKDVLPNGDVSYLNPGDPKFDPALLWRGAARYNGLPKLYQDQADTVFGKDAPGYLGSPYVVGMMYDQTDGSKNKNFLQYTSDGSSKKVPATSQLGFMPLVIGLYEASGTKLEGAYSGKPIYVRVPVGVATPVPQQPVATEPTVPVTPETPVTTPPAPATSETPVVVPAVPAPAVNNPTRTSPETTKPAVAPADLTGAKDSSNEAKNAKPGAADLTGVTAVATNTVAPEVAASSSSTNHPADLTTMNPAEIAALLSLPKTTQTPGVNPSSPTTETSGAATTSPASSTISASATPVWIPPQPATANLAGIGQFDNPASTTPSSLETAKTPVAVQSTQAPSPAVASVAVTAAQASAAAEKTTVDLSGSVPAASNGTSGLLKLPGEAKPSFAPGAGEADADKTKDEVKAKANAEAQKAAQEKAAADAAVEASKKATEKEAADEKAAADAAKKPAAVAPSTNVETNKANIAASLAIPITDVDGNNLENIVLKRDSPVVLKALNIPEYGGYPLAWRKLDKDAMVDSYGMYTRECVSYAAFKVQKDGIGMTMPSWGGKGNAWEWERNAKAAGIAVDKAPAVGSVMQWGKKGGGAPHGSLGHVAYVEKILADGSVVTTEYNNGGQGTFSIHVYSPSYLQNHADQVKFIHFEK